MTPSLHRSLRRRLNDNEITVLEAAGTFKKLPNLRKMYVYFLFPFFLSAGFCFLYLLVHLFINLIVHAVPFFIQKTIHGSEEGDADLVYGSRICSDVWDTHFPFFSL